MSRGDAARGPEQTTTEENQNQIKINYRQRASDSEYPSLNDDETLKY